MALNFLQRFFNKKKKKNGYVPYSQSPSNLRRTDDSYPYASDSQPFIPYYPPQADSTPDVPAHTYFGGGEFGGGGASGSYNDSMETPHGHHHSASDSFTQDSSPSDYGTSQSYEHGSGSYYDSSSSSDSGSYDSGSSYDSDSSYDSGSSSCDSSSSSD